MRPHVLRIETGLLNHQPVTTLLVDGVHVLEVERQPGRSLDGDTGDLHGLGPDPADLLPPFSRALLPSAAPTPLMIGICGCGNDGDYSLWVSLRRDGRQVVWEPMQVTEQGHRSVRETWRFDLVAYLDAIDAATGPWQWESTVRLVARELNDLAGRSKPRALGPRGGHLRDAAVSVAHRRGGVLVRLRDQEPTSVVVVAGEPGGRLSRAVVPVEPDDTADDVLRRLDDDPSLWLWWPAVPAA
jgi:hypothetical protein